MSYMSVTEFKSLTGVTIDDNIIDSALATTFLKIRRYIYIPRDYKSHSQKNQHVFSGSTPSSPIRVYVGDFDGDGVVNALDINAYEIGPDWTEYDLNGNITSFNEKYGVVNFDVNVPTASDRLLVIRWYQSVTDNEFVKDIIKEVQLLEATNYLFMHVPFEKLQSGISSWNLNGVSVSFDRDAMQAVIDSNNAALKGLYNLLIPLYTQHTTLQAPSRDVIQSYLTTQGDRNRVIW